MLLSFAQAEAIDENADYFCPGCGSEGTLSKEQEGAQYRVETHYRCLSHQQWGQDLVRTYACEEIAKLRKDLNESEQQTTARLVHVLNAAMEQIEKHTNFSEPFKSGLLSGIEEAIARIEQTQGDIHA